MAEQQLEQIEGTVEDIIYENTDNGYMVFEVSGGGVESAASGFLVGIETARRLKGQPPVDFPREMAVGALALYISNESVTQFQPMNINFGIIPPLDHFVKGKRNKNAEISQRALAILEEKKADILA